MSVVQRKIGCKTFAVYAEVASEMDALAARLAEANELLLQCVETLEEIEQETGVEWLVVPEIRTFLAEDSATHRENDSHEM